MATEIIMPKNGMDMKEGFISRWLINVGDKVEKDDPIIEIETDKVTMETEAPASGVLLAKYFGDGETVPVLTVLGYIGQEGEQVPMAPEHSQKKTESSSQTQTTAKPGDIDFDVAVIGGGPAGYVGAIKAAQLGGKVILFEKDALGGVCLNKGCIPTKSYLETAKLLKHIRVAENRGIENGESVRFNMQQAVAYKNQIVATLSSGISNLLWSWGVQIENSEAFLADEHTIISNGKQFTARNILLCTGSRPAMPPIRGIDHPGVLTSDGILELGEIPESLCIIGGGIIGCEMAAAFREFGSDVIIIEAQNRITPTLDIEISNALSKALKASGVQIRLGELVSAINDDQGRPAVIIGSEKRSFDKVLISIGRIALLDVLGNMREKFKMDHGFIRVNDHMETSVPGIYAAGDLNGQWMLAHVASHMAKIASINAMGGDAKCELSYTPSCVYTIPEAASVGMTEAQARDARGQSVIVGRFPFSANGRSLASGHTEGFVKVVADGQYGELLGVQIVGATATEMIAEAAGFMQMEVTVHEIAEDIIHAHPSFSEVFAEACADALNMCIHQPKKKRSE